MIELDDTETGSANERPRKHLECVDEFGFHISLDSTRGFVLAGHFLERAIGILPLVLVCFVVSQCDGNLLRIVGKET
jgi:hypothetical protein